MTTQDDQPSDRHVVADDDDPGAHAHDHSHAHDHAHANAHDQDYPLAGECTDVVRDLYLFLDDELDDRRRNLILGHIEACSPCLEAFDFEVELKQVVAARVAEDCPTEVRDRIMTMLREALPPDELA
jgi:mycothiol system anti-sigma-R factor